MISVPFECELDTPGAADIERDAALWRIYDSSFPSSEREPREVIIATVRDDVGCITRAREGGATIAFAFIHHLHGPPAAGFLVYLVVAEPYRGMGLGRTLFDRAWRTSSAEHPHAPDSLGMIWEVEIPENASSAGEAARRRQRIAFFEHQGGVVLSRPYVQPPVDGISAVPMYLMVRPSLGGAPPDDAGILALVRSMYVEKYQRRNGISAHIIQRLLVEGADARPLVQGLDTD